MKLQELDEWYNAYENSLDELRIVNWRSLSHAKKLEMYLAWKKEEEFQASLSYAAKKFHENQPPLLTLQYPNDRVDGFVLLSDGSGNLFVPNFSRSHSIAIRVLKMRLA